MTTGEVNLVLEKIISDLEYKFGMWPWLPMVVSLATGVPIRGTRACSHKTLEAKHS